MDADHPLDLSALPAAEAVERIKDLYGFLRSAVEVTIEHGVATITIADEQTQQTSQALRTLEQAIRQAQRGNYERAVSLFQDVLQVLPEHTAARRQLAMALMESGDYAAAKKHLIRVLQLDPDDAWAYLILGNVYMQAEHDLGSAERYYQSALDSAPDDAFILNSMGMLQAERGHYAAACRYFQAAGEQRPDFPNPRYGLALAYVREGKLEEAQSALRDLFAAPGSEDRRHQPVYAEARTLYRDIHRQRALERAETNLQRLRRVMDAYAKESGTPIEIQEDPSLNGPSKVELAWVHGRTKHIIRYRNTDQAGYVYLLAHEFEHIVLATEARAAGRERLFATDPADLANARHALAKDVKRLDRRLDLTPSQLEEHLRRLITGLANQTLQHPVGPDHRQPHP